MTSVPQASVRAWLPYFLGVAAAWGASFLFIQVALQAFTPAQVGLGRVLCGSVVLIILAVSLRRLPTFTWRKVGGLLVVGAFMSGIPLVLIPFAQQHVTSILASLLNATTPLWTALFVALFIPAERVTRAQLMGLLIGAFGIAVLLGAWRVDDFPLVGAVFMLSATACYGIGSTLSRIVLSRVQDSPVGLSAMQMSLSLLVIAPFAVGDPLPAPGTFALSSSAMWAIIALGLTGTSFAYVWYWRIVQVAGATTAASVTYAVPVVATTLGVVVLDEHLHWYEIVGAVIVMVGVWLAQRGPQTRPEGPSTMSGAALTHRE